MEGRAATERGEGGQDSVPAEALCGFLFVQLIL